MPPQDQPPQSQPTQSFSVPVDSSGTPLTQPQTAQFLTESQPQAQFLTEPQPQAQPQPQVQQPVQQPQPQFVAQPQPQPVAGSEPPRKSRVSRRYLLRGAAGVGVAGVAAVVGAGSAMAVTRNQPSLKPVSKPVWKAPMAPSAMEGPLVVYISDTTTGDVDVFAGTGQMRMKNPALVRELLNNLK